MKDGLERGEIAPVRWAIVMNHMDEAVGVTAWVYAGNVLLDEFEGEEGGEGADTEQYLERYHGVLVNSCGPYRPAPEYDPVSAIADVEAPTETLREHR